REAVAQGGLQDARDLGGQKAGAGAHVVVAPLVVDGRGQEGDRRLRAAAAGTGARALVVQVEAEPRLDAVPDPLERAGFGAREPAAVAVDVHAGGAVPLEEL